MLCTYIGGICTGGFSDDEAAEYVQHVHASWFGEAYRLIALVGKRAVRAKEEPCHRCCAATNVERRVRMYEGVR